MARRKSSNPFSNQNQPELDISPLIDVAFLLLIYFLVTSALTKQEADLGLSLPGVASLSNRAVPVDQMAIRISPAGAIYINDELVENDNASRDLPSLTDRLERYSASAKLARSEALVVINCHGDAVEQRFIDVLNACTAAGLKNISLAN